MKTKQVFAAIVIGAISTLNAIPTPDSYFFPILSLVSVFGFLAALWLIPKTKDSLLKNGMWGIDLNKIEESERVPNDKVPEKDKVPESAGIFVGTILLVCCVLFQPFFSSENLGSYNAGLLSVCLMLLLGFSDDVLDVRWRYKIILSAIATLPLIVSYTGSTDVIIPIFVQKTLGWETAILHLGPLYYIAMAMICVFCTNSINIYAGVNGLEAGQSIVIAIFETIYCAIEIYTGNDFRGSHKLSLAISTPFVATSLGMIYYNWFPSAVFVGDSFTYLAGMTIAVSAVLGHFSKTLMLFFIPELLNFFLSLPQLIGIVPCPRHRLPRFSRSTGKIEAIWPRNLNLLNFALHLTGPLNERTTVILLVGFQIVCCSIALISRYTILSHLFIGE